MRHLLSSFSAVLLAMLAAASFPARASTEALDIIPKGLIAPKTGSSSGLPHMERRGDDLIIYDGQGAAGHRLGGYMKGMSAGDTKIIALAVKGRGRCFIKINAAGATIAAKCDD